MHSKVSSANGILSRPQYVNTRHEGSIRNGYPATVCNAEELVPVAHGSLLRHTINSATAHTAPQHFRSISFSWMEKNPHPVAYSVLEFRWRLHICDVEPSSKFYNRLQRRSAVINTPSANLLVLWEWSAVLLVESSRRWVGAHAPD